MAVLEIMALSSDQRKNVRFLLLMVILLTIPCYCLGVVVLRLANQVEEIQQFPQDTPSSGSNSTNTPAASATTFTVIPDDPTAIINNATAPVPLTATFTKTFFLTWTRTPTQTATNTLTPTNTPTETPTKTFTPTDTPMPSETPQPTETETNVFNFLRPVVV